VLVSAIQKISRCVHIAPGTRLYRGLGGKFGLPDSFQTVDDNGCVGYTEWGFMSTTTEKAVALQYSGVNEGQENAFLMVIHPTSIDRGACIVEFSQFVALFTRVTVLQGIRKIPNVTFSQISRRVGVRMGPLLVYPAAAA
jgi:hypothetical protein